MHRTPGNQECCFPPDSKRSQLLHTEDPAPFSDALVGHLRELCEMGCARISVDLSHCGAVSSKGRQIFAALTLDQQLSDTITFNYVQGQA